MKLLLKISFATCLLISFTSCNTRSTENESEELETDGMEQAMQQEFWMTRDPQLNQVPTARLELAKEIAANMRSSSSLRVLALGWQERGPNNIGGRTRCVLVDKSDASGNTVLASSVAGGIFRTTNFLAANPAWAPVDDKMLNLAVTVMIQDRTNPAIMYAGTGEGWFNIDAIMGAGIFKSTDGGITWSRIASTANFEFVQDIVQDLNGNLYAAVRNNTAAGARGVQRSTNGGTTWTQVLGLPLAGFNTGRAADLEVASNGDIFATLGIFTPTQVLKSSGTQGANTGALNTWLDITPVHTARTQRGELAIAPSNPLRVYLMLEDSATSQVKLFYRSSDGGVVWDSLAAPAPMNNGSASQVWYNMISAVDPTNPDIVSVAGYHIGRSFDAGVTFTDVTPTTSGVHVDHHVLEYTSATNLINGNDGGLFHTTNANIASPLIPTFTNKNNGFNVTQFYGADMHPTNVNYFLAGAQDNNTQKFTTAGINSTVPVVGGDGGIPHIDQTDGQLQIAATTNNNFYRSTNGGANWASIAGNNNRGPFISPSDLDDVGKTLYASDNSGSYYYINGLNGTPANGTNSLSQIGTAREVTAVKVDPFNPLTVWLGASWSGTTPTAVLPVVVRVSDANTPGPSVSVSAPVGTAATTNGAYISSVDVDPANGNHLLATLSNYGVVSVFESTDGGASWNSIEGNLPDMPVYWGMFAPRNAQLNGASGGNGGIMLATELGVWTTSAINGASTQWIVNSGGFPNVRTDMLKLRWSDMTVLAATHGRGLFTTTLPFVVTGVPSVDNTKSFIKYTSANSQQLFIKVGNLTSTKMQIRIFDIGGRLVKSSDAIYTDQFLSIGNLPSSSYVLKIYGSKGEQYTYQFVK